MCHLQEDVSVSLPATASALQDVRRIVREATAHEHIDHEQGELVALIASEASSNVLRHTRSSVIDLTVACDEEHILVRVGDDDPTLFSAPTSELWASSGRGLLIIDRVATRWGVAPTSAGGKELWVETPARRLPPSSAGQTHIHAP